jgi:hypothetical protein
VKWLRKVGLYLGHVATALIGTAIIASPMWKLHRPRSVSGALWQDIVTGFVCAAFLRLIATKISRERLGVWVWVAIVPFFILHIVSTLAGGSADSVLAPAHDIWARIFGFDCIDERYVGQCGNFFEFTVPLVRTVAYSLGAVIGFQAFVPSPQGETASSPGREPGVSEH